MLNEELSVTSEVKWDPCKQSLDVTSKVLHLNVDNVGDD